MTLSYTSKLGLKVWATSVKAQKIDISTFQIFKMVFASFQVENKLRRAHFFQETFLVANTNIKIILEISFLSFSNTDVKFIEKKLI